MVRDEVSVGVKICGLRSEGAVVAALKAGASYIGFVFAEGSPRFIQPELAFPLARLAPKSVKRVGLFVDPDDVTLRAVLAAVPLDLLQLHGDEPPERVEHIGKATGLPVMKALRIGTAADLESVAAYESVADMLLFDAKVGDARGGTGVRFDWGLLLGRKFSKAWMLAGGLTASNLAEACRLTGARILDVSSGVEDGHGVKDPAKIAAFIEAASAVP